MLLREDPGGLIVITQPAHAWLAGQIARCWGNGAFGGFEPREAVCLAAEQHDCGWAAWEEEPTLNPATGRPHSFRETARADHLDIWTRGPQTARVQSRYAGLLVSRHGTGLYARFGPEGEPDAELARHLAAERARQADDLAALRADPDLARHCAGAILERNCALIAAWDMLSLHLCHGGGEVRTVGDVPAADGRRTTLTLTPDPEGRPVLDPWPFAAEDVSLEVEGRRLAGTFSDREALRRALHDAPCVKLVWTLTTAAGARG